MQYVTQKVIEALEVLIGENSAENAERLGGAALKVRQGALPVEREKMSGETKTYLRALESDVDFYKMREALIGYIIESQRDAGRSL